MLRNLKAREVITIFRSFGFEKIKQKGSHIKLARTIDSEKQILTIPNHDPIAKGTLRAIYKQAGKFVAGDKLRVHFFDEEK